MTLPRAMNTEDQYQFLLESLRLVAAPAAEQLRILPDFVVATDEIVLTADDALLFVPQLVHSGMIRPAGNDGLTQIRRWLDSMPQDGTLSDALSTHDFWAQGRALAEQALTLLGEELRSPDLRFSTWVEGR